MDSISFAKIFLTIISILEDVLEKTLGNVAGHDFVRFWLESSALETAIWTPPKRTSQLSVGRWMFRVEKVPNSHETFVLDKSFEI